MFFDRIQKYDQLFDTFILHREVLFAEYEVLFHGFECLLGLILIALEEKKNALLCIEFHIVVGLVLDNILVKLFEFLVFIFIMFNLAIEKES